MSVQFTWPYTDTIVELYQSKYCEPNNIALIAYTNNSGHKEEFGIISVNPSEVLKKGYVAIKNWSENEGILNVLIREGIISTPRFFIKSSFVDIPICKLLVKLPIL